MVTGRRLDDLQKTFTRFDLFARISKRVPVLADIRPSGRFLMEDFYYAGGLRALMNEIRDLLHLECKTVNGQTLGDNLAGGEVSLEPGEPAGAEDAAHRAADLGGDAERHRRRIGDEHRLELQAIGDGSLYVTQAHDVVEPRNAPALL